MNTITDIGWRQLEPHEVVEADDERRYSVLPNSGWLRVGGSSAANMVGLTLAECREKYDHSLQIRRCRTDLLVCPHCGGNVTRPHQYDGAGLTSRRKISEHFDPRTNHDL